MNSPPSYAPTSSTSFTISSINDSKYHSEVTKSSLVKSSLHKSTYDALAEIFSILPTLEMLENSYVKDYITDKEKFTSTSYRLIHQYQIIAKGFLDDSQKLEILKEVLAAPDLSPDLTNFLPRFSDKFNINTPNAINRLQVGIPATIEQLSGHVESNSHAGTTSVVNVVNSTPVSSSATLLVQITANFLTCMDAIKLNYRSKDQLHPLLSELVVNLNDLVENGNHKEFDFQGKSKLITWLIKLNNLDNQELSAEDADSFFEDLDSGYKAFYESLASL
ncbi:vacuolar protein sorting-associated [Scheffersomyces xylosifermentans]|uniref:vacuolar protein sorting-associated n=1 Tax=Scheffersomyces xylosifermentans TaxID=1304137 RepID=UPI00315C9DB7